MCWSLPSHDCFPVYDTLITAHRAMNISTRSFCAASSSTNTVSPSVVWLWQKLCLTSTLQQLNSAQDKRSSWSIQFTTLQSHSCIPSSRCTIIKIFYSCFSEICHGIDVQSFREQFKTTSQGCLQWVCYSGPYRSWASLSGNAKPPVSFACTRFWQSELLTLLSYTLDEQDHVRPPGRNANPPLAKQSGSPHHDRHISLAAVGSWSKPSPVLI